MRGLGPTDLLIILAVLLLIFGGRRLPPLARGLHQSIEEWRRQSPYESGLRREEPPVPPLRHAIISALAVAGLFALAFLAMAGVISEEQAWVVVAVVTVWLLAGFYSFGRRE